MKTESKRLRVTLDRIRDQSTGGGHCRVAFPAHLAMDAVEPYGRRTELWFPTICRSEITAPLSMRRPSMIDITTKLWFTFAHTICKFSSMNRSCRPNQSAVLSTVIRVYSHGAFLNTNDWIGGRATPETHARVAVTARTLIGNMEQRIEPVVDDRGLTNSLSFRSFETTQASSMMREQNLVRSISDSRGRTRAREHARFD